MVDLNKLSADVRTRIEGIMGMEQDAKKIDSQKEYQELGKLLSGDGKVTGKQKEIVEGMLMDYEDTYMVRNEVKQRVQDLIKNGNGRVADDQSEIHDLKQYKKTKGLSKEEKAFIQRVIDGKEVDSNTNANKFEGHGASEAVPTPSKGDDKANNNTTPANKNGAETQDPQKNVAPEKKEPKKEPEKSSEPKPSPNKHYKPYPQKNSKPKPNINNNTYAPVNTPINQHGKDNINIIGNRNTIIVNGGNKTEDVNKPSQAEPPTPKTGGPNKTKKPTQKQLETLANQIFDAIDGVGTKDTQLRNALNQITKDNILELLETYNANHPDMFEGVLDDLSRGDYTFAVNVFKNALLERGNNDPTLSRCAGAIDNELDALWRSDETIVNNLHEMVRHIQEKEEKE